MTATGHEDNTANTAGEAQAGACGTGAATPNLDRVRAYAAAREFEVRTSGSTQREPEYVVALLRAGSREALISRRSLDSLETAAFYLVNSLEALGVEVPDA
jgi:hypothetical protein